MEAIVSGISLKGKNRIREHGDVWDILKSESQKILIQSKKNPNVVRWVERMNDSDMRIVSILD